MRFTLRQLDVFVTTARLQHLGRAAAHLAMSQSAASDALRELESQHKVELFDRLGKRLQLNERGRLLLPRAEELLTRAQELESVLLQEPGREAGSLRVGATLSIGNHLCVPLIDRYRQHFPQGRISLEIGNTATISERVLGFELDVGLIEGEINNPLLDITPWREDALEVFASPSHPLAALKQLRKSDLLGASWILRENGSGTRQTFDRVMYDLLPDLRILLEIQQPEAIMQAVRAGLGIGCLSRLSLAEYRERGDIVVLPVAGRRFARHLYLIVHRQKYRTAAMQHWIRLCGQKAASTPVLPRVSAARKN